MPAQTETTFLGELRKFSILKIERPFLQWKDTMIPPSPALLDKRVARYVDAYLNGGDTAIPLIWDAIKGGANPDQSVKKEDGGTEPLIVKAARNDAFFLVQALTAAGANIDAKDSNGQSAIIAAAKIASVTISSYLLEQGAAMELKQVLGGANPALATASLAPFNSSAAQGPAAAATNPAVAPKAQANTI